MRPLARTPVKLKGIYWGSDMRMFLRGAEVWLGNEYWGDISAEWLEAAVEKELVELALSKRFQHELEPHPLRSASSEPPPPARAFKEARRAARATRKPKRA